MRSPYKIDDRQTKGRPRIHPITPFERECDQSTQRGLIRTTPDVNRPHWLAWKFSEKALYIDGEWHLNTTPQKFYLLGYAYDEKHFGWLYNQNDYSFDGKKLHTPKVKGVNRLNRTWLLKLLDGVKTIYFYGPDAGQIERMFHIKLKDKYNCVNLLTVAKNIVPKKDMYAATKKLIRKGVLDAGLYTPEKPCWRLCCLEELLGIKRDTVEYKKNIDNLHRDWYNPKLRAKALLYNKEDVMNLIKTKKALYEKYNVPTNIEKKCTLQLTKADKNKFKSRK